MEVHGYGSITQMDKSKSPYRCRKWLLQVRTSSKRFTKRFIGSKAEAKGELNRWINEIENDRVLKSTNFCEYCDYWYKTRCESKRYSPNTLATNKKYLKKWKIIFKDMKLYQINAKLIRDNLNHATCVNSDKQLSGTCKHHMYQTLNCVLNMAVIDDLISFNPCRGVATPKKDTKVKCALSKKQLSYLFDCLEKENMSGQVIMIYLMALLGLRRQEAIILTWGDYNSIDYTISINKAYKAANRSIGEPKSKSSKRVLPVPKKLQEVLKKWKNCCEDNLIESDYICCSVNGHVLRAESYYEWWKKFKVKYDIPDITFHELRHTNFTIVSANMNQFLLKEYAGWSDLKPASIYIHENTDLIRSAIDNIDF